MEKFTQGDWVVCNGGDVYTELGATNSAGIKALDSDGWCIAVCDGVAMTFVEGGDTDYLPYNEMKANARLIAAAPDMYRALKGLLEAHRHVYGLDGAWDNEVKAAQAALAKADGEQGDE